MAVKIREDLSLLDDLLKRQQVDERERELALLPARPKLVAARAGAVVPARRVGGWGTTRPPRLLSRATRGSGR